MFTNVTLLLFCKWGARPRPLPRPCSVGSFLAPSLSFVCSAGNNYGLPACVLSVRSARSVSPSLSAASARAPRLLPAPLRYAGSLRRARWLRHLLRVCAYTRNAHLTRTQRAPSARWCACNIGITSKVLFCSVVPG